MADQVIKLPRGEVAAVPVTTVTLSIPVDVDGMLSQFFLRGTHQLTVATCPACFTDMLGAVVPCVVALPEKGVTTLLACEDLLVDQKEEY